MKHIRLLALTLAVIVAMTLVSAASAAGDISGTCGDSITWTLSDKTLTITGSGAMDDFDTDTIPWGDVREIIKTVNIGEGITYIGTYAFYNCNSMRNLTLPTTLKGIGDRAFYCADIIQVELPDGLETIGEQAFGSCWMLCSITLPESIVSVGDSAFEYDSHLVTLNLPEVEFSLGENAFRNTGVKKQTIPSAMTEIPAGCFAGCYRLTDLILPATLTRVGDSAFEECKRLTKVTYGGTQDQARALDTSTGNSCLTALNWECADGKLDRSEMSGTCGEGLTWTLSKGTLTISGTGDMDDYQAGDQEQLMPWYDVQSLVKTVVIEEGVTRVGNYAFYNCSLSNLKIPSTLVSIGDYAFCDTDITQIVLPEGFRSIGANAFYYCWKLNKVTLPSTLESIGDEAFACCSRVTALELPNGTVELGTGILRDSGLKKITLPEGITAIPENTFNDCKNLSTLNLPASLTGVGENAFSECGKLKKVSFAGTQEQARAMTIQSGNSFLSSLNWNCSDGVLDKSEISGTCGADISWTLAKGVLTITGTGDMEDYGYSNAAPWYDVRSTITSISVGDGITRVGSYAFDDCDKLKTVNLPATLKTIGESAFSSCSYMAQIGLPEGLETIEEGAFEYCWRLKAIKFPSTIVEIGKEAFNWDGHLFTVEFPAKDITLDEGAFINSGIKQLVLPEGLTAIPASCFAGCDNLTNVTLPSTLTTIGENAFSDCPKLKIVTFAGSESGAAALQIANGNSYLTSLTWKYQK